jgi:GAF domain-containing protein/HAMP domain-containing protein
MSAKSRRSSVSDKVDQNKKNLANLIPVVLIMYSVMSVTTLALYLSLRSWQHLGVMGLSLLNCIISLYALYKVRGGKSNFATLTTLAAAFLYFPLSTLFWSGASLLYAVITVVFINALAQFTVEHKHRVWIFIISLGVSAIPYMLDNISLPWQRYDVTQWLYSNVAVFFQLAVGVILSLWRLIIAYQSIKTIGLRLSVTLGIGAFLVAVVMSSASMVVGIVTTRNQVLDQLDTVADLKEDLILAWLQSMQSDLDTLFVEINQLDRARLMLTDMTATENRVRARDILANRFKGIMERTGRYDEIFMANPDGLVMFSTNEDNVGKSYADGAFLINGLKHKYIDQPRYVPDIGGMSLVIARPLSGSNGRKLGIVAARVNLEQMQRYVIGNEIGQTGISYVVAENYALLTPLKDRVVGEAIISYGIHMAVKQTGASGAYLNYQDVNVFGVYQWLPSLGAVLVSEVDKAEIIRAALPSLLVNSGLAVSTTVLGVLLSLWMARGISTRLTELAAVAERIADGEGELTVPVTRDDEVGVLAQAFNDMTVKLNTMVSELEHRVEERTRGLTAAAEVSRAATSELNPEKLMPQVVNLVCDQFDLYYVGLFLVDDLAEGRYAILRAGSGDAGKTMIQQDWRLPVGGESMVGQCISTGLLRVKQSDQDIVPRFDNPILPETQSELALPLHYGQKVIGAMTVQSEHDAAFDETMITLFQNMADQVAIVIENARLFAETQAALDRSKLVQQRYQVQAWRDYMAKGSIQGFELRDGDYIPLGRDVLPEVYTAMAIGHSMVDDKGVLTVPIIQSGQVVGALGFDRENGNGNWSEDQISLIEVLAEQLILAAENQRLLDETQTRASREQLTREITEQIRASLDVNMILQTAVREIGQVMGLEDLTIELHDVSSPASNKN